MAKYQCLFPHNWPGCTMASIECFPLGQQHKNFCTQKLDMTPQE